VELSKLLESAELKSATILSRTLFSKFPLG